MNKEKVCHYWAGDMMGGEYKSIMKKVTKSDIGGGGGSKIWHFRGEVIFEWPLMAKLLQKAKKVISDI